MASAEQRAPKKWRGIYRDSTGRKRSVPGTFASKGAALKAANEAEVEARKTPAHRIRAADMTWGDWCEAWWNSRGVEPETRKNEASMVNTHIAPTWAEVPLAEITRHGVQSWATEIAGKLAPASAKRVLGVLVSSLSAAIDADLIDANPATRIKLPPMPQGREAYLTRDEFDAVAEAALGATETAILQMLAGTGMRWGELAGLHWHNLDLMNRMIAISDVASGGEIKPYPKGRRQRHVPVFDWSLRYLQIPLEVKPCATPHRGGAKCRSGLVFPSRDNTVMDDRNFFRRTLEPALKDAGLGDRGVTLHSLRHSYASWLVQAGVPLERVGQLLGHASITTTQRYAHFAPPKHDDLAVVFGALKGAPGDSQGTNVSGSAVYGMRSRALDLQQNA